VFGPDGIANLIEQFSRLWGMRWLGVHSFPPIGQAGCAIIFLSYFNLILSNYRNVISRMGGLSKINYTSRTYSSWAASRGYGV
jgi:hypothetical protein